MIGKLTTLALIGSAASAETISCEMANGDALQFAIDHNQFVDALDPNEPPRRKVTMVLYGNKLFPAEPIVMGDLRGFEADGMGGTTLMFVMQPGGDARLTNSQAGLRVDGTCEVAN